jgi:hypothetical protein
MSSRRRVSARVSSVRNSMRASNPSGFDASQVSIAQYKMKQRKYPRQPGVTGATDEQAQPPLCRLRR